MKTIRNDDLRKQPSWIILFDLHFSMLIIELIFVVVVTCLLCCHFLSLYILIYAPLDNAVTEVGGDLPDDTDQSSLVPIHIVDDASQLPHEFLNPSAEKKLVIGFDCEGVDLCRNGALCVMQVSYPFLYLSWSDGIMKLHASRTSIMHVIILISFGPSSQSALYPAA